MPVGRVRHEMRRCKRHGLPRVASCVHFDADVTTVAGVGPPIEPCSYFRGFQIVLGVLVSSCLWLAQLRLQRARRSRWPAALTMTDTCKTSIRQCVLFIGDSDLCQGLAQRLCSLTSDVCPAGRTEYVVHLSNKYYTASVKMIVCDFLDIKREVSVVSASHSIEGVVLVTARGHTKAARRLEAMSQIPEGPDIRMLVVDTLERVPDSDAWKNDVTFVCTEHCTEYCEVSLSDDTLDSSLYDEPDSEGCKRVLDALQAHIWPEMTPVYKDAEAAGVCPSKGQEVAAVNPLDSARVQHADGIIRDIQGALFVSVWPCDAVTKTASAASC